MASSYRCSASGLANDRAGHLPVAQLHRELQQHGLHRQRKGVDRLDVPGARVAVALAHVDDGHEVVDGGVDGHLFQHHLSLSALQCRGHGHSHLSASSLRVWSTSDAARRTIDRTASAPRPASWGSITSSTPGASVTWVRNVTSPGRRARGGGRGDGGLSSAGHQLADPFQAQAGALPGANRHQLLDVPPGVVGAALGPGGPVDESLLDVVTDGAPGQIHQRAQLVYRDPIAVVRHREQYTPVIM